MKPKTVIVNANATITEGILNDQTGLVVGYNSDINEVWISLDDNTTALVKAEMIEQGNQVLIDGESNAKFSDSLDTKDLKFVAEEYAKLVNEHAHLLHFKETAEKLLSKEQLEEIEEEMENIPEVNY